MEAANDETLNPGGDTIVLKSGCTYYVDAVYADDYYALPPVTSDIVIVGHGATIRLADDAAAWSLFEITASGSLVLSDVTLAEAQGGGSAAASVDNRGSTTLTGVTLTHSIPLGQGGPGIVNRAGGVLAVTSSTIEHQSCNLCMANGIHNLGDLTISDTRFDTNTVSASLRNEGTAAIFGSTFVDGGQAIYNVGDAEVHASSFVGNQNLSGGAIVNKADLFIEGSYFGGNTAVDEGGAILNGPAGIATVENSTFYDNMAASPWYSCCVGSIGGAIANHYLLRLRHVSFLRNGAAQGADVASPEGAAVVYASAFDSTRGGTHCSGTVTDNGANVVDFTGSGCPSTFIVGDPQLTFPAVNGSGTRTAALGPGSAAFDAVDTAGCLTYDQRGVRRPVGARCDAGAFEDQRPGTPQAPSVLAGSTPSDGTFVLTWPAGTDPDGIHPGYRVYRRDADDAHGSEVASVAAATTAVSLTNEPEGTMHYAVAADDGNLLSAKSSESASIVIDRTPPTAPARSADRAADAGNWWKDTVTITFSGSTDPDLPDGSPGSGVAFITAPVTLSTSGVHTVTGVARDTAGNESSATTATARVDADAPSVEFAGCPQDVVLQGTSSAAWSASDASSGIAGPASGAVPLDTTSLGSKRVTVSVSDLVGHRATAACDYRVIYDFSGFFKPLAAPPTVVTLRAGDTIAVAFGLGGYQGMGVLAPDSPQSIAIDCGTLTPVGTAAPTMAARPLDYVTALGGRYRYQWVTSKAWAGSCRRLSVALADGTTHLANVRIR